MACTTNSVWLALCPCLPIKHIAKTLIRLGGWPCCGFVRVSSVFWTRKGPYSPWLKDLHVQLSEMGFRRFGLVDSRVWSERLPYVWVLQALYLHLSDLQDWPYGVPKPVLHRKGHLINPYGTRSCYTKPKLVRTHREPGEHMWQLHHGRVQTSHRQQTRMAPQVLRAGKHPWVPCMQPKR